MNRLVKLKEIINSNNKHEIKELICIPTKFRNDVIAYFHFNNIHCSYQRLIELFYNNNLYWNNI